MQTEHSTGPTAATGLSALEAIASRRSVRRFGPRPIDTETRRRILAAGMAAPSAHGKRPWRFALLEDQKLLVDLVASIPWYKPAASAPCVILVLGKPDLCVQPEYWTVDCAAATQNILVAARALGLGSLWMGIAPIAGNIEKVSAILDIPAGLIPFSLIALGEAVDPAGPGELRDTWTPGEIIPISGRKQP